MVKKLMAAAFAFAVAATASAEYDTMYVIKDSRVVGKFPTENVDYIAFSKPEGVEEGNIWLNVNDKGKNTVTYTVNTLSPMIAYAHNVLSYYDVNYNALSYEGDMFDNLPEDAKINILKLTLQTSAYVSVGTNTFTQRDHENDGTASALPYFSVVPGTRHFLCAWELDAATQEPKENLVYTEFSTDQPGESDCDVYFTYKRMNKYGIAFDVTGSNVYYLRTSWGLREVMDSYVELYGMDFLMGTFGEVYDLDFLQGTGDFADDIENSTWPTDGSGDYVLFVRAYDTEGNMTEKRFDFKVEETAEQGPDIRIFSKEKGDGYVNINFEIAPSNVEEAYVRLCQEDFVLDRLNMGYELHEIACGGDATDITSAINNSGEYTFKADGLENEWKALLIYAKDENGHRTTLRVNFFPDTQTEWAIYKPVYKASKRPAPRRVLAKGAPVLPR